MMYRDSYSGKIYEVIGLECYSDKYLLDKFGYIRLK
jgi:hypothetical protein